MSGDGDDPAEAPESTQETAAFVEAVDVHDPWSELTPPEEGDAAEWIEAESVRPAHFADPIPVDDLDVTPSFAPVPASPIEVPFERPPEPMPEPAPRVIAPAGLGGFAALPPDAANPPSTELTDPEAPVHKDEPPPLAADLTEDFTRAIASYPPPEVYRDVTPSFAPKPADLAEPSEEVYVGDGPFAAPVDKPAEKSVASFQREFKSEPIAPQSSHRLDQTIMLKRRAAKRPRSEASRPASVASAKAPSPKNKPRTGDRHYPKMRALLQNPDAVPYGAEPPQSARSRVVPGTFFPAPRAPLPTPAPADLDGLLATMAEGLLIGETADGHTEVRVTLKDEFFAGTELRITLGDGSVTALLVPPDRDVYWQLNGNIDELRERLTGRGLRVQDIQVADP